MCISHNLKSSRDVAELVLMAMAGLAWPREGSGIGEAGSTFCLSGTGFLSPAFLWWGREAHAALHANPHSALLLQTAVPGTWLRSLASSPPHTPQPHRDVQCCVFSEGLGHTPFLG